MAESGCSLICWYRIALGIVCVLEDIDMPIRLPHLIAEERRELLLNVGLLVLRIGMGSFMLFGHGWGKLANFSQKSASFPDPLGVGSFMSLSLVIGAEVLCAGALILGLATRLAAIPLAFTMVVAAFVIHADDPWQKKEFALLYLVPFVALMCTGAGKYSLDSRLRG
jgi:putative oxidoreductase